MTSNQTSNIIINVNTIKDNIESLNKDPKIYFNTSLTKNSTNSPKNTYFSPNFTINVINQDPSPVTVVKNKRLKTKFKTIQSKSNLKFKSLKNINIPTNSNKDLPLKESEVSNYNLEYLKDNIIKNQIQTNNNNKLIEPKFYDGSNDMVISNPIRDINYTRIKFRESARFKDRNLFNKFKVFHYVPKKVRKNLVVS